MRVYRLVTSDTYESSLAQRANQKRGLEQAIIGGGDYSAKDSAAGTKLKARAGCAR